MVNLVIAVLSETYSRLNKQKLGLYYDGVIEVIPAYKYKKFYGALIAGCPPFNLLVLPFLPYFMFSESQKRLRYLNNNLVKVIFFPFSLIYASVFAVVNFLLVPFAYIATTFQKLRLAFVNDDEEKRNELVGNFFMFFFLGLPMLLLA